MYIGTLSLTIQNAKKWEKCGNNPNVSRWIIDTHLERKIINILEDGKVASTIRSQEEIVQQDERLIHFILRQN